MPAWRFRNRLEALARAGGRCEHCREHRWQELVAHHAFGRRNVISEPLASHHVLLAVLCEDCHRDVHDAVERFGHIREVVRLAALARARRQWAEVFPASDEEDDPVWIARRLEAALRASTVWAVLLSEAGA